MASYWTHVGLGGNSLTGSIPSELGQLQVRGPAGIELFDNMLTGEIPSELGLTASLKMLALQNNRLSGHIPTEMLGFIGTLALFNVTNNDDLLLTRLEDLQEACWVNVSSLPCDTEIVFCGCECNC